VFVERRIANRQRQIMRGIPDALDLLVTCTEAGLGLNQALQRVADEIRVGYPELSNELDVVNAEIGAGVDRGQALAGLHARTGLKEIRGLVSMFNQTMRFGTSIADALRTYAEEFRDRRTQAAEEKAAKLGTKMIFPLVLCFFPAFFVVAIGPAGIKIIRAFSGMSG
jgi:tight adherence protein C